MPGWMNAGKSYVPPVGIGEVMRAGAVGEVPASHHLGFEVGQHVVGMFGVQECAVSDGRGVLTVDPALAPLPAYLGTLPNSPRYTSRSLTSYTSPPASTARPTPPDVGAHIDRDKCGTSAVAALAASNQGR